MEVKVLSKSHTSGMNLEPLTDEVRRDFGNSPIEDPAAFHPDLLFLGQMISFWCMFRRILAIPIDWNDRNSPEFADAPQPVDASLANPRKQMPSSLASVPRGER